MRYVAYIDVVRKDGRAERYYHRRPHGAGKVDFYLKLYPDLMIYLPRDEAAGIAEMRAKEIEVHSRSWPPEAQRLCRSGILSEDDVAVELMAGSL